MTSYTVGPHVYHVRVGEGAERSGERRGGGEVEEGGGEGEGEEEVRGCSCCVRELKMDGVTLTSERKRGW